MKYFRLNKIDQMTDNSLSHKLIKKIEEIVQEQKDNDELIRIYATLLSEVMVNQWRQLGFVSKEDYRRSLFKILSPDSEDYIKLSCFDHPGYFQNKKEKYPTIEPYQLGLDDLKEIIDICIKNDLRVIIDGESPHFPGKTVRIMFMKNEPNF